MHPLNPQENFGVASVSHFVTNSPDASKFSKTLLAYLHPSAEAHTVLPYMLTCSQSFSQEHQPLFSNAKYLKSGHAFLHVSGV